MCGLGGGDLFKGTAALGAVWGGGKCGIGMEGGGNGRGANWDGNLDLAFLVNLMLDGKR